MSEEYLDQIRDYLTVIHNEFELLYNATNNESFAMDIEYKITSNDQLIIKQARPWVSYMPLVNAVQAAPIDLGLNVFPNPAYEFIYVQCEDCQLTKLHITDIMEKQRQTKMIPNSHNSTIQIFIRDLPTGVYVLSGITENNSIYSSKKFVKR